MKHLLKFNETLKSYRGDIIERKLDDYFDKKDYIRKYKFTDKVEHPHYMIINDKILIQQYGLNQKDDRNYYDIQISWTPNTPEILKDVLKIIETSGYFIASMGMDKEGDPKNAFELLKNEQRVSLFIEPNYDEEMYIDNEYIYHATPKKYVEKILKYGLAPKTKNKRSFYPSRVYFSTNHKSNTWIKTQLESDTGEEFVTLKVKNFPGLRLYNDLRSGGVFTYQNIAPKYIEVDEQA